MDESIDHRLEKLGISVWKKKHHDEIDYTAYNQYLLNNKYILFFSEMENNENDDDNNDNDPDNERGDLREGVRKQIRSRPRPSLTLCALL